MYHLVNVNNSQDDKFPRKPFSVQVTTTLAAHSPLLQRKIVDMLVGFDSAARTRSDPVRPDWAIFENSWLKILLQK